jgi:hypothetical protein
MPGNDPTYNDKNTSNLLLIAIGIIAVGIFCIFVEFSNNKAGNGLFISCIIVVCGLSLYSIVILMSTYKIGKTEDSTGNIIKTLLVINSIINIAALVYFIVIFSKKASDIMKLEILNYIKPYLKAFINTIVIIIIVNIFIYHYLTLAPTQPSDYIPLIIVLAFFGLAECIIEIVFLNIIDKVLKNITDG